MDKSKWEYKKLGEVATFLNGYAFKPENWSKHGLKIIRIQNLTDETAPYNHYEGEIDSKYIVRNGDLLISWSATLGAFLWNNDDALLNQHIFKTIFDKSDIDKFYLKYCVISKLEEMAKKTHGVTMRHITKKDFDNTIIPYPSLSDQQRIVAELDCLNEMIALKQEQLKEFDKLAQSIFYDMFGEPDGFEKVKLGDVVEVVSGLVDPNTEPYCSQLHVSPANIISGTNEIVNCVQAKAEGLISDKYPFKAGMILYSKIRPNLNKVAVARFDGICSADMYPLSVLPKANNVYITKLLSSKQFLDYAIKNSGRARMPKLNRETLFSYSFNLPPLALQQQFAEKIQAIEAQKELVKQSIAETQHLFDSRMDYYFN